MYVLCLQSNGSRSPMLCMYKAQYDMMQEKRFSLLPIFLNWMIPNHWQADPEKVLLLGLSMSWLSDWLSVGSVKAISLIRTCLLLHLPLLETVLNRGEHPGVPSDQAFQTWRAVAKVFAINSDISVALIVTVMSALHNHNCSDFLRYLVVELPTFS